MRERFYQPKSRNVYQGVVVGRLYEALTGEKVYIERGAEFVDAAGKPGVVWEATASLAVSGQVVTSRGYTARQAFAGLRLRG